MRKGCLIVGELNNLQLLQLNIAKDVAEVCRKNDIPYFMCGGTMLGAIRHKGFIPWDDDMDFGMTRDNYEKFLEIAQKELGDKYFVQTWDTDPGYGSPFAKIRLNGTEFVEKNSQHANMHKGIYIDIFPWDNVPDNDADRKKQWNGVHFYWHLLMNKCKYDYVNKNSTAKVVAAWIFKVLSYLIPLSVIHKGLYSNLTKYKNIKTDKAANFCGGSPLAKEMWERRWLTEFAEYQFETTSFSGPEEWDEYLTHFFGDYMTPPPEDKRVVGHNIVKIDFGKYKNAEKVSEE